MSRPWTGRTGLVLHAVLRATNYAQRCLSLQMTIREALNSAIDEEMEKDDSVVLLGMCHGAKACVARTELARGTAHFLGGLTALRQVRPAAVDDHICVCRRRGCTVPGGLQGSLLVCLLV